MWMIYSWLGSQRHQITPNKILKKRSTSKILEKVKKFLRVYYGWGRDVEGAYANMIMEKDVNKFVEGYEKYTGSGVKFQKTPGAPVTTLSKSNLEEPYNIDKYIVFVVQLRWYTTKVGTDVENTAKELAVQINHTGPEHCKLLGRLVGYLKGKDTKGIITRKPKVLKAVIFVIRIMPHTQRQERVSVV